MFPDPALRHFSELGQVARSTRLLMARAMARGDGRIDDPDQLELTLRHLGDVREGFVITLRTSSLRSLSELRDLVRAILVDWDWLEGLGIKWAAGAGSAAGRGSAGRSSASGDSASAGSAGHDARPGPPLPPPDVPLEKPVVQVLSFAHASVTLGVMRHLPTDQVTFPDPTRTYADIPVPRSPGEVLERIEEMEGLIARSAQRPLSRFGREPLRRTYGYFETGAWLVGDHVKRFGRS